MKKSALMGLLILLMMAPAALSAKMYNAIVYFKNGEKLECLSDQVGLNDKKFKIRRDVNSPREVVKKGDVDIVEIVYADGSEHVMCNIPYVPSHKAIKGDYSKPKNNMWLPLVKPGEYLSVFQYSVDNVNYFFLKKSDVDFAILFPLGGLMIGSVNKAVINYLSDYPELCELLKERKVKIDNLYEIVDEYNQWRAEGGK